MVKRDRIEDRTVNKEREAAFLADKSKQAQLLKEAEAELAKEEKLSEQLKTSFSNNEKRTY